MSWLAPLVLFGAFLADALGELEPDWTPRTAVWFGTILVLSSWWALFRCLTSG